ncbi:cyclic-di-AMP receptor [Peptoniphilus indolicus]|uniref:Nitrogen regulatory protein P-II family protein n=2 Tax=Peptoniphilus indolicus TaxID=33030 RepID=G4D0Y8_9FIRM|nr:cyclic-di-AMP receptor [Peptoniphilus indolicus]EGY80798.1 nitrogen regulatory protein P-II family protein [Peptoniphilus indolicus ATCC 29427]SUB74762.1 Uncharacterized protein conserved in bacteria [Peptoniphilus indolicus]
MKMMIAIVQEKFIDEIMDRFYDEGVYVTKISSSGGFFKNGNSTLLLGCEESEIEKVYSIFKEITKEERVETEQGKFNVSGATIFVVDVEDNLRI